MLHDDVDVVKVLDGMLLPAMLLVFSLPIPEFLTPGLQRYKEGIRLLEGVVAEVLQVGEPWGCSAKEGTCGAFKFWGTKSGHIVDWSVYGEAVLKVAIMNLISIQMKANDGGL
jgi:hypothetical protein